MPAVPRINTYRLLKILLLGVVLPLVVALLVDMVAGTLPIITIVALLLVLPGGAFFMLRAALDEMDKLIDVVAPEPPEPEDAGADADSGIATSA